MVALQKLMEQRCGYDEDLANSGEEWFEFRVVCATEDVVSFVDLRQQWEFYLKQPDAHPWHYSIRILHETAEDYIPHLLSTRSQIPRGHFLTVDYGGGEGEVFNYIENLTEQEIGIFAELLHKYIYQQGGVFDITAKDDLAVDDPARCIHLQWEWDIFKQRLDSDDIDDNDPNLCDHRLSCNLIDRILEWRATTPAAEANEPESDEADSTENVVDNSIVRADTHAEGVVRTDSEADTDRNSAPRLPDTPDVRDLCHLLQKDLPKGRTQNEIAREFTGEMPDNDKKAQSLLRQARRYRHLWDNSES